MLIKKNICAVIVTYNGIKTIEKAIDNIVKNEVDVVIVDNNSTDGTIDFLQKYYDSSVSLITNNLNYGIAYALNKGVRHAKEKGYSWVLTMDQDSFLEKNAIDKMIRVYSNLKLKGKNKVAILAVNTNYQKSIHQKKKNKNTNDYQYKKVVITSGNLVKISAIENINWYNENLFIDSVDFDFCLRLKKYGYIIILCKKAMMKHNLGEIINLNIFGIKIRFHIHSGIRKYFIARNHIFILKKYFLFEPLFCIKKSLFFILFIIQSTIYEKNKASNFKLIAKGIFDGVIGKYNKDIITGDIN